MTEKMIFICCDYNQKRGITEVVRKERNLFNRSGNKKESKYKLAAYLSVWISVTIHINYRHEEKKSF